jgi:hypothetical protein
MYTIIEEGINPRPIENIVDARRDETATYA